METNNERVQEQFEDIRRSRGRLQQRRVSIAMEKSLVRRTSKTHPTTGICGTPTRNVIAHKNGCSAGGRGPGNTKSWPSLCAWLSFDGKIASHKQKFWGDVAQMCSRKSPRTQLATQKTSQTFVSKTAENLALRIVEKMGIYRRKMQVVRGFQLLISCIYG